MPKFKSLKEAQAHVMSKINDVLANEVLEVVRKAEIEAIQEEVYSAYTPSVYGRREADGGMLDPRNIQMAEEPTAGVLVVVNTTRPNTNRSSYRTNERKYKSIVRNAATKNLPEQIEYGHDDPYRYDFPTDGEYMNPRPFTDTTIHSLDSSGKHIEAIKSGLRKRGLNVVE